MKIIGVNSENIDGIVNNLAKDYSTNNSELKKHYILLFKNNKINVYK